MLHSWFSSTSQDEIDQGRPGIALIECGSDVVEECPNEIRRSHRIGEVKDTHASDSLQPPPKLVCGKWPPVSQANNANLETALPRLSSGIDRIFGVSTHGD